MAETLKEKTAKGLFWGGLSNGVQQMLNLVFGIFLARLLSTEDYGLVGMLNIFTYIAVSLQEGGFITALNRKQKVSHKDYNAVFWTSTLTSLMIYVILFFSAPLIADFYNEPRLTALARFIFLGFFITSLGIASRAQLFRNMMVRQTAIVAFVSQFGSGVVGITLAYFGFAYWGIAIQTLVYVSLFSGVTIYFAHWHPTLPVDFKPVKEMLGFSSKLIITNIVNVLNTNAFTVILGRLYTPHVVGNYSQANKWNYMSGTLIGGMLGGVAQPVFARTDSDKERQKRVFRKLVRFTALVSFPALFGLALVAKEFIVIMLTEKWLESAVMLQILCIGGAFSNFSGLFVNLIVTRGHSTTHLWVTVASCIVQLAALILTAPYGIYTMLTVNVAISILWTLVWFYFGRKEIDLRFMEVVKDVTPYLAIATFVIVAAHLLTVGITNLYFCFAVKVVFVAAAYCLLLWLSGSAIFRELLVFLRHRTLS